MGIKMVVSEDFRLPELNAVYIPKEIDDLAVRKALLNEYGIEIGGGLGKFKGKVWRIGLMGYSSKKANVMLFLSALEDILTYLGYKINERGIIAAADVYRKESKISK
jgi:alanine-glyoxylate transaminase/serine-glyoxylate transaminase/serine-pyruvate transaminase